jgi:hypothetical protein
VPALPASKLLQDAVRNEMRRRNLRSETDRFIATLVAEVGEPGAAHKSKATTLARRIAKRASRTAG